MNDNQLGSVGPPHDSGSGEPEDSNSVEDVATPSLGDARFHNSERGLYALLTPGDPGGARIRICGPLRVEALVRSVENLKWGKRVRWYDPDGNEHQQVFSLASLQGDGLELCRELSDGGLMIEPGLRARTLLLEYLASELPGRRIVIVTRTGWHGSEGAMVYALPRMTIGMGKDGHEVQLASGRVINTYTSAGTVDDWKRTVGALCACNSRLLLAVSMAFAAVLLPFSTVESGGLHFIGVSSLGKTTVARVAASVFGGSDYMQRWRTTLNGLEATAALHNCALLILDEMGQVDPREVGESSYMLANGQGKQRATKTGGAAQRQSWQLLFLSTGETGLSQHMALAGKQVRAGQEVRLAELQADAGKGHGIFDELHGLDGGALLAEKIKMACRESYGEVGVAFIRRCVADQTGLRDLLAASVHAFVSECESSFGTSGKFEGQARRVCERFALKAAAGELATKWGLTGWSPGEAHDAIKHCFGEWLTARGTAGNSEAGTIIETLRAFISRHEDSRFVDIDAREVAAAPVAAKIVHNRAGWRKRFDGSEREYLIDTEVFRKDIFAGFDLSLVCRVLSAAGYLHSLVEKGKRRYTLYRYVDDRSRRRVYVITGALWSDASESSAPGTTDDIGGDEDEAGDDA